MSYAPIGGAFDVQHRDCFESLAAMRDAGGADLILTSPPYPDARKDEAYGASFDTSLDGYAKLGDAIFDALKPGGVCALNIDGPVRVWRPEMGESERSLVAFEVALDWAKRVGFRYIDHCAYVRSGIKLSGDGCNPRWSSGWEPVHVFSRPGAVPYFNRHGYTVKAKEAGRVKKMGGGREPSGEMRRGVTATVADRRAIESAWKWPVHQRTTDRDHSAPFSSEFADAFVRCYGPPAGIIGDPFVGSGTVAFAVHRAGEGRRFIGEDLGIRKTHKGKPCGRRWADIVNDGLRQGRLFS
jgi:DNA modification methylase